MPARKAPSNGATASPALHVPPPPTAPQPSPAQSLPRVSRPAITTGTGARVGTRRRKMPTPAAHAAATRTKRGPRTSLYKYVRKVGGMKFQARVYQRNLATNHAEWLNLGLYTEEVDAWAAVRDFVHTGRRPPHLLPKFVRRTAKGEYVGTVRKVRVGNEVIDLIETAPQRTAEAADAAMRRKVRAMFGQQGVEQFYPFG